jgi:hypothetical protein
VSASNNVDLSAICVFRIWSFHFFIFSI